MDGHLQDKKGRGRWKESAKKSKASTFRKVILRRQIFNRFGLHPSLYADLFFGLSFFNLGEEAVLTHEGLANKKRSLLNG